MAVTGTETLAELRSTLAQKMQSAEDFHQRNLKGELSPDEVAAMRDLGDEITELEGAIKAFPTVDNFREKIDATKTFLRQRSTVPPPSAGRTVGGDGAATKAEHGGGGSPASGFGVHIKSLGAALAEELKAQKAAGRGWRAGEQQAWGVEFEGFDRVHGYCRDDGLSQSPYKATLDLTAAPLTRYDDQPGIVALEQQRLTVADLLGTYVASGPTVRYIREDAYSNAATSVAMGAEKPEASWDLSQVSVDVTKIAVVAKVADEMFEDYPGLQSYVDGRLRFMVLEREEALILNGDGTPPNMRGILQTVGIQTESASSAADNIDAVMRGLTKIQAVGHFEPDGIVMHPTDYRNMRLTRDLNDQYYGGGPFTGAYGNTPMPRDPGVWAQRTVVTTAISAGTVLVGNFRLGGAFARKSGLRVQATNTNEDDFIMNLMTIRAEERGVVLVYRPLAFCAVTLA